MSVLIYALPYFLMAGETFQYTKNTIEGISKYLNKSPFQFMCIKEKQFKNVNLPLKETIIKSHKNLKNEVKIIIESENNIYHCMHNGFSIPNIRLCHYISSIYTVLPITNEEVVDKEYYDYYIKEINNAINLSYKIIVPCNFIKKILKGKYNLNDEKIEVIYPCIEEELRGKPKELSKIYVRDKFNINTEYILFMGELNNRTTLKEELYMFYTYNKKDSLKFVVNVSYLNKNVEVYKELLKNIESLNLSEDIILLSNITYMDKVNLINSTKLLINLDAYSELNITMLMSIALKTKVLCYATECNFEMLEDYPIYYEDNMDLEEVINDNSDNLDDDMFIIDKYNEYENTQKLFNVYERLLNEVEKNK